MRRRIRLRPVVSVFLWLVLALVCTGRWTGHAQPSGTQAQDDPRFTGLSTGMEATGLSVSRRRFEAGARSAWHSHTHGQLLFVEEGRARTQKRGLQLREMGPGESDYTGPDQEHWHGAAPDQHFIQVATGFGRGITWLDKVTDEEYGGGTR